MVIASPWSRGGYVNSEVFDHTSNLQFLERFIAQKTGKKIKETNISEWRRTICGDLTSVFRPYNGEQIAKPTPLKRIPFVEGIHKAQFRGLPTFTKLSDADIKAIKANPRTAVQLVKQEKGTRPACAIPYELYADGRLNDEKTAFEINFKAGNELFGDAATGGPFNVYAPEKYTSLNEPGRKEAVRTWSYAAKPGDTLTDKWPLADFEGNKYHLRTYGPNGFYRQFRGSAKDPGLVTHCGYQRDGNVVLTFSLVGTKKPLTVEVTDNAYKTASKQLIVREESFAPQTIKLDLSRQQGWYDFTIRVKGYADFKKRYAGRVETGKTSISDPYMGGEI
jgi:phospholipase C